MLDALPVSVKHLWLVVKEVFMLSTEPHQAVLEQHRVYLWGRYSLCLALLP